MVTSCFPIAGMVTFRYAGRLSTIVWWTASSVNNPNRFLHFFRYLSREGQRSLKNGATGWKNTPDPGVLDIMGNNFCRRHLLGKCKHDQTGHNYGQVILMSRIHLVNFSKIGRTSTFHKHTAIHMKISRHTPFVFIFTEFVLFGMINKRHINNEYLEI